MKSAITAVNVSFIRCMWFREMLAAFELIAERSEIARESSEIDPPMWVSPIKAREIAYRVAAEAPNKPDGRTGAGKKRVRSEAVSV